MKSDDDTDGEADSLAGSDYVSDGRGVDDSDYEEDDEEDEEEDDEEVEEVTETEEEEVEEDEPEEYDPEEIASEIQSLRDQLEALQFNPEASTDDE